jgi:hypothetical protein
MNVGNVTRGFGHGRFDGGHLGLQLAKTADHPRRVLAFLDHRQQALGRFARLVQALAVNRLVGPALMVEPVGLFDERAHRLGRDLWRQQPVAKTRQNPRLQSLGDQGGLVGAPLAGDPP